MPRPLRRAVFPGTFDPVTFGHLDVIRRGASLFDGLIVAVAKGGKAALFPVEERVAMLVPLVRDLANVTVEAFDGLIVSFAEAQGARILLRGVRTFQDWEYELRMAHTNRGLAPGIETVFLAPSVQWSHVSSSLTREVASLGGDVSPFVPPAAAKALAAQFPRRAVPGS
jgi:pantetheine-phosphate adenylyltransferase